MFVDVGREKSVPIFCFRIKYTVPGIRTPPVEGAANKACCAYFAKLFGVAKSAVELLAGDTSRHKRVLVRGVTAAEVEKVVAPLLAG